MEEKTELLNVVNYEISSLEDIKERELNLKAYECCNSELLEQKDYISESFFNIGVILRFVKKFKLYELEEYNNIYEYAEDKFNIKSTSVKNLINIVDKFGDFSANDGFNLSTYDNNIWFSGINIKENYKDYSYSQLVYMKNLNEEELSEITPDKTITEIKAIKYRNKVDSIKSSLFEKNKYRIDKTIELIGRTAWPLGCRISIRSNNSVLKNYTYYQLFNLKFTTFYNNNNFDFTNVLLINLNNETFNFELYQNENVIGYNPIIKLDMFDEYFYNKYECAFEKYIKDRFHLNEFIKKDDEEVYVEEKKENLLELDTMYSYKDIQEKYKYLDENLSEIIGFNNNEKLCYLEQYDIYPRFNKDNITFVYKFYDIGIIINDGNERVKLSCLNINHLLMYLLYSCDVNIYKLAEYISKNNFSEAINMFKKSN